MNSISKVLLLVLICTNAGFTQSSLSIVKYYEIQAQSLDLSLIQLAKQSGINISFNNDLIKPFEGPKIAEQNSFQTILEKLLSGKKLSYKIISPDQLVVVPQAETEQEKWISGRVTDSTSGELAIGVLVYDRISGAITSTNEYGYYTLLSHHDFAELHFSFLSKKLSVRFLSLTKRKNILNLSLNVYHALPEVVVTDSKQNMTSDQDLNRISVSDIQKCPPAFGESDLIRTLLVRPGTQSGADGFGGLSIRGGSYDQNLYLLDDIPIYYPSHAIGLLSIFNTDAIRNVNYYTNAIPSNYSGRLSGVVDVHTKEGNLKNWEASGSMGLLCAKLMVEGPLVKDRLSILAAGRRTLLDPFIKEATKYFKDKNQKLGNSTYYFYDITTKLHLRINDKQRFYLSYYSGKDFFHDEDLAFNLIAQNSTSFKKFYELHWQNFLFSGRYNFQWNKNFFSNLSVYQSIFKSSSEQYESYRSIINSQNNDSSLVGRSFYSNIIENGAQFTTDYSFNSNNRLKVGARIAHQQFKPNIFSYNLGNYPLEDVIYFQPKPIDSISGLNKRSNVEFNAYAEDYVKLGTHFSLVFGVRMGLLSYDQVDKGFILPRGRLEFKPHQQHQFFCSYDQQLQSLHLLSANAVGLPTDLWVPSTKNLGPESMKQWNLGYLGTWQNASWNIQTYFKTMDSLLHLKEGADFRLGVTENWESQVTTGMGTSYGIESGFHSTFKNLEYTLNYAYSKTSRKFDEINRGQSFRFLYDRPHQIRLQLNFKINEKLQLNALMDYSSGSPVSLPLGKYEYLSLESGIPNKIILVNDKINKSSLPDIYRLDVSLDYNIKQSWGYQELSFGIYNILNRRNPVYIELSPRPDNPSLDQFQQVSLMPILPSFSYKIRWTTR